MYFAYVTQKVVAYRAYEFKQRLYLKAKRLTAFTLSIFMLSPYLEIGTIIMDVINISIHYCRPFYARCIV